VPIGVLEDDAPADLDELLAYTLPQAVLVHDATPPQPAAARLPGLCADTGANQE